MVFYNILDLLISLLYWKLKVLMFYMKLLKNLKLKKNLFTPEERIANALQIIDSKGFFTLSEYAQANNLSRTVASKELAALTADHTSPIETSGRGTHKVWVRRIMK